MGQKVTENIVDWKQIIWFNLIGYFIDIIYSWQLQDNLYLMVKQLYQHFLEISVKLFFFVWISYMYSFLFFSSLPY